MKKLGFIISMVLMIFVAVPVYGVANTGMGQQAQQPTIKITPTPTGNQVKNQNQIRIQNQGEDAQLEINNQEQENLGEGQREGSQNRSENALEHMSVVAQKVQELLQLKTAGGIGDQVREIARTQHQAQTQIKEQLNKLEERGWLTKLLLGADTEALNNLRTQLLQNQVRIRQLEQLKNQLSNSGDQTKIQETIQALIAENTSLREQVNIEEQTKSLFGWLVNFLNRK